MKKSILFIAAIAALSFTSCKKDRTCTCTTTTTNKKSGITVTSESSITYVKARKGDVRDKCLSTKDEDDNNSYSTTCKLK